MSKKGRVLVHRVITEEHAELSRKRLQEAIDICGGRLELVDKVNEELDEYPTELIKGHNISCCLHKKRVTPQIAIRIEKALSSKKGMKQFTRQYFCPDMNEDQFNRVEKSMFLDSKSDQ